MNKKLKHNISIDYIFTFIARLDLSSSIWVLYMIYKGLSLWEVGLVEGVFHITSFLCEVPTGAAADLLGRKRVILLGRVCCTISCILCLFGNNVFYFCFAFAISAIGYNLNSGSEEALVYDSMKAIGEEARYIKVNSRINVLLEITQGLALVAGGILSNYSFYACYIVAVIIALISIVPALLFTEPPFSDVKDSEKVSAGHVILKHFKTCKDILWKNPALRRILLYYPLSFTFYAVVFFYGQEYFNLLGLNKIEISLVMLLTSACSCFGALCSEKLLQRFGSRTKYLASLMICFGILGVSGHCLWVSIVAFAFMGFGNSILYPLQSQSINELIPSAQRATIISIDSMLYSFFMILLFPICGALAEVTNLHVIFSMLGILQLLIMLCITGYKKNKKK